MVEREHEQVYNPSGCARLSLYMSCTTRGLSAQFHEPTFERLKTLCPRASTALKFVRSRRVSCSLNSLKGVI